MPHTTLTSKGQVTVPAEIRQSPRLQAGDRLVPHFTDNGFAASVERTPKVEEVYSFFRHAARPGTAKERAAFEEAVVRKMHPQPDVGPTGGKF